MAAPSRKPKTKEQSQRQKFIEAARELGCDENEEAFKEALKRVAKASDKKASKPE